jgi:hypothetical protein
MTRFYDIDAADALLLELGGIVGVLGEQRVELVRLRDDVLAASDVPPISSELPLARLRMQGLIDQMAAGVARIDALGLTLRDIERGLVDFPALVSGRQIWLCWQLGETTIGWWHGLDTGFDGRRPLAELA